VKWRALMAKDGSRDKYAICFSTHTVCKVVIHDRVLFEAWREGDPAVCLARYTGDDALARAQLAAEQDARGEQVAA
jgi:hypothetical protein